MACSKQSSAQRFFNILELVEGVVAATYSDYKRTLPDDYIRDATRFLRFRLGDLQLVNKNFHDAAGKALLRDISLVHIPQPAQANEPRRLECLSLSDTRYLVRTLQLAIWTSYRYDYQSPPHPEPYDAAALERLKCMLKRFDKVQEVELITSPSQTLRHLHLIRESFNNIRALSIHLQQFELEFTAGTLSFLDDRDLDNGSGSLGVLLKGLRALKIHLPQSMHRHTNLPFDVSQCEIEVNRLKRLLQTASEVRQLEIYNLPSPLFARMPTPIHLNSLALGDATTTVTDLLKTLRDCHDGLTALCLKRIRLSAGNWSEVMDFISGELPALFHLRLTKLGYGYNVTPAFLRGRALPTLRRWQADRDDSYGPLETKNELDIAAYLKLKRQARGRCQIDTQNFAQSQGNPGESVQRIGSQEQARCAARLYGHTVGFITRCEKTADKPYEDEIWLCAKHARLASILRAWPWSMHDAFEDMEEKMIGDLLDRGYKMRDAKRLARAACRHRKV